MITEKSIFGSPQNLNVNDVFMIFYVRLRLLVGDFYNTIIKTPNEILIRNFKKLKFDCLCKIF